MFMIGSVPCSGQTGMLTAGEQLPFGSQYSQRYASNPSAVDTTSGTNVTWNFADLALTGTTYSTSILAPAATPYGASFPSANYAVLETNLPRYSYFDLNTSNQSRVGFYYNGDYGHYSDTQIEQTYPLQYGSSNSDTWDCDAFSFPGTYAYQCIGKGSLQLPSGTYNDVLLLRVRAENGIVYWSYQWVNAQNGAFLVLYFAPSIFQQEDALVLTSLQVGLDEVAAEGVRLRVHGAINGNLPITYSCPSSMRYRICDVTGRLEAEGYLPASTSSTTATVPVQHLVAGIHVIDLIGDHGHTAARFLME